MNRVATAGEMSASIAHEINQPLAAMVTNANAGLRFLTRAAPDLDSTRAALERVVKDGHRAGDVIKSIRAMFNNEEKDQVWLDINEVVRDVLVLLQGELQAQGITVRDDLTRQLWASSDLNYGAVFHIALPAGESAAT